MKPTRLSLAAAVAALVLVVAGCGDEPAAGPAATTSAPVESTSTPTSAEDVATAADEPAEKRIVIGVAGGEVTGGGRVKVAAGEEVTLEVTSDVADEVHLHGYDESVEVGAGETATLTFTADITGVFEVELENSKVPLADLVVQ